jgi:hypothetical protein
MDVQIDEVNAQVQRSEPGSPPAASAAAPAEDRGSIGDIEREELLRQARAERLRARLHAF